ncbi:MAG: LysR family transcriptional regulator [Actinomyces urogenitalis]|uniref:LysR family transcriptional regulator n=1 Tax=Actinomyces urogenitalis TaxID=103621 RepID=UPI002911DCC0|nr:LysR family transcriptional regulator [Actinomyces urogenitalis]MDU6151634.1 LysR family transcriptional regulator [Actinomyces urogenitalis]
MDFDQLRQLEAIARLGTVSAAARELHLSQPALSRSLARLEKELGHQLFERAGRRLVLSDVGDVGLEHARALLRAEAVMRAAVDEAARRLRTLRVGTVAPAPLWRLTALTVERFPQRLMTSSMLSEQEVASGVREGSLDLGITLRPHSLPTVHSAPLMAENLAVVLPRDHGLAGHEDVSFAELDGETFLLFSDIGFWRGVCDEYLAGSTFVLQQDREVFRSMAASTELAYFVTDAPSLAGVPAGRVVVPIRDTSAHATFYLVCHEEARPEAEEVFAWVRSR